MNNSALGWSVQTPVSKRACVRACGLSTHTQTLAAPAERAHRTELLPGLTEPTLRLWVAFETLKRAHISLEG